MRADSNNFKSLARAVRGRFLSLVPFWGAGFAPRALARVALCVWGINMAGVIHSCVFMRRSEKFYDLIGAVSNIAGVLAAASAAGLRLPGDGVALQAPHVLAGLSVFWAGRLGAFLFQRIQRDGKDRRFDNLKKSLATFVGAWNIQAVWNFSVPLHASVACIAHGAALRGAASAAEGASQLAGAADAWRPTVVEALACAGAVLGLAVEALADRQKWVFRLRPENKGRFIQTGLWKYSRHPNYFGEIMYHAGAALLAHSYVKGAVGDDFFGGVGKYLPFLSPLVTTALLCGLSGIPLLEKHADDVWGDDEAYRAYKAATPVLVPWIPSGRKREKAE